MSQPQDDERNPTPEYHKVQLQAVVVVKASTPEEALQLGQGSQYNWLDWDLRATSAEAHEQPRLQPGEVA